MSEFKREDRYVVLKRKDLQLLPITMQNELNEFLMRASHWLPDRKYVVVESDWPEHDEVFKMLETRFYKERKEDGSKV